MKKERNSYVRFYELEEDEKIYTGEYGRITKFFRAGDNDEDIDSGKIQPVTVEYTFNILDETLLYDEATEEMYLSLLEARAKALLKMKEQAQTRASDKKLKGQRVLVVAFRKLDLTNEQIVLAMGALGFDLTEKELEVIR